MRLTFAIYLEMSLDASMPGFCDAQLQYEFAKNLDRGAIRRRREIERVEFENVTEADEPACRQFCERVGPEIADHSSGVPFGWRDLGSIAVCRVPDAPNPTSCHGMEGDNPAVTCPRCGRAMKYRPGTHGKPFYGCSQYPACKGTRSVSA